MTSRMIRLAPREAGFTLIEVVVTIIVLAIALGILVPFVVSLKGSASPVVTQQAITLAQERLEQIIADRSDTSIPRGFTYATTPGNYPAENPVTGFTNFTRSVAIACVTTANLNAVGTAPSPSCSIADGETDYARVTVTVTNATSGPVSVVSLLANR
jgi:prepilin-type N-terminal cleavage/methylation domain-containing protein